MVKIVIEIHLKDALGGKLIAKMMEKPIKSAIESVASHPSIEKIESRVE